MLIQNRRTEQPMEPMVIIREHAEENQGQCRLHADTKQKNRTANGTSGYEKEKKKDKRKVSSLCSYRTEQSMVPVVIIREHNEENQAKCHFYAHTENRTKENVISVLKQRTAYGINGYDQRT